MASDNMVWSLVFPYGSHSSQSCGYCKGNSDEERNTWGMGTESLAVSDYQYLIDRGWRRSGTYCYKPLNNATCCPCYTIRCDALNFRPSRSHKRILRTIRMFFLTGSKTTHIRQSDTPRSDPTMVALAANAAQKDVRAPVLLDASGDSPSDEAPPLSDAVGLEISGLPSNNVRVTSAGDASSHVTHTTDRSVPNCPPTKATKARQKRWICKLTRMREKADREGSSFDDIMREYTERRQRRLAKNQPKPLEELLPPDSPGADQKHFIEIRLVRSSPRSAEFERTVSVEHALYQKYQVAVHGDDPDHCDLDQFTRFLIDSPLVPDYKERPASSAGPEFGSYHQQYWLDGQELIAVGVVDLLPRCLSSVYFFYDPDYAFLHLGTYSALREIALVRKLAAEYGPRSAHPDNQYAQFDSYYMGYFIRSCPKMAYKAQYRPCWLACPETYLWVPIDECLARLDAAPGGKYARFSAQDAIDENAIPAGMSDEEVDRRIRCHLPNILLRTVEASSHVLSLSEFKRFLRPHGVQILRDCARLIGQRVLSGHIHFGF